MCLPVCIDRLLGHGVIPPTNSEPVDVVSFFSTKKEEKYIMSAPLKGTTGNPVSAPGQTLIL